MASPTLFILRRSLGSSLISPVRLQNRFLSSTRTRSNPEDEEDLDAPVRFSTSDAARYTAKYAREHRGRTNRPKYEPEIVKYSIVGFLIYFCILREENDMDAQLGKHLYETLPEMEIVDLKNKRNLTGLSDTELQKLRDLERMYNLPSTTGDAPVAAPV